MIKPMRATTITKIFVGMQARVLIITSCILQDKTYTSIALHFLCFEVELLELQLKPYKLFAPFTHSIYLVLPHSVTQFESVSVDTGSLEQWIFSSQTTDGR